MQRRRRAEEEGSVWVWRGSSSWTAHLAPILWSCSARENADHTNENTPTPDSDSTYCGPGANHIMSVSSIFTTAQREKLLISFLIDGKLSPRDEVTCPKPASR